MANIKDLEIKIEEINQKVQNIEKLLKKLVSDYERTAEKQEEDEAQCPGSEFCPLSDEEMEDLPVEDDDDLVCALRDCESCGMEVSGESHECDLNKDKDIIECHPCHFGEKDCPHCSEREKN
ncbi:MAG: hypothetical protein I3273_06215 [Candidatus Moeniiplasma glomeromycotorum]|nr:hypothetical protein [Candidatus Moeniiplasma glomeromycotorum]MCE8168011.1 hypothetical protein [Candidatus Moeniiplasma glomeromycotorum]MCE8169679.1 hypothetical protein [Candidatus Moeniiplasma glomeromycotorum]